MNDLRWTFVYKSLTRLFSGCQHRAIWCWKSLTTKNKSYYSGHYNNNKKERSPYETSGPIISASSMRNTTTESRLNKQRTLFYNPLSIFKLVLNCLKNNIRRKQISNRILFSEIFKKKFTNSKNNYKRTCTLTSGKSCYTSMLRLS